jgi:hypothetical protein
MASLDQGAADDRPLVGQERLAAWHRMHDSLDVLQAPWVTWPMFLELYGLASLNQESSGGLYTLHSHLNHSCEPNVQVCLSRDHTNPGAQPAEILQLPCAALHLAPSE